MLEPKEIVLVPCPYTDDLSVEKFRPMIILSTRDHNNREGSVFGLVVTSNPKFSKKNSPFLIEINESDFDGKLRYKSFVLADAPYTTYTSEIRGTFGKISDSLYTRVLTQFNAAIQSV